MLIKTLPLFFIAICSNLFSQTYHFSDDPIDVIIPCHEKDVIMLEECIKGIRKNGKDIRKIFVISKEKLTDNAEFFPEDNFPFSKEKICSLVVYNKDYYKEVVSLFEKRVGWIYQQLLKFYAPLLIPNISENALLLDADTVFLNPVSFKDPKTNAGLFAVGYEYHKPYFIHGKKLIPDLKKVYSNYSGICNHMLFQKSVLIHLFSVVESTHKKPFWKAFCEHINPCCGAACSEFEIYFNFAFMNSNQFSIRHLLWKNAPQLSEEDVYNFHFVSCHDWLRDTEQK